MFDRMLTQRIAAIRTPLTIRVQAASAHHSAAQATAELIEELVTSSHTVTLQWLHDPQADGVVVTIAQEGMMGPVSFWGAPTGFEVEGLVYALECLDGARPNPDVPASSQALLGQISRPLACDLYVTPT
jgi:alkyl hydroperoxide reductase subunit AhpF